MIDLDFGLLKILCHSLPVIVIVMRPNHSAAVTPQRGRRFLYALLGATIGLASLGLGFWKWQALSRLHVVEDRRRHAFQLMLDCSSQSNEQKVLGCLFAQLDQCEVITLHALKPREDSDKPWRSDTPRTMFSPSQVLVRRDLQRSESTSVFNLLRRQHLENGATLCFNPSYGLSCTVGGTVWVEWSLCFSCAELEYAVSLNKMHSVGSFLFNSDLPEAVELRQTLSRLLPHPQAAFFEKPEQPEEPEQPEQPERALRGSGEGIIFLGNRGPIGGWVRGTSLPD